MDTDKGYCHDCQLERGGKPPRFNPEMRGITVCEGTCDGCKQETTIVPSCDYDWPQQGKKAVFD